MEHERSDEKVPEFTDEECSLVARFSESYARGEKPDMEQWLGKLPGSTEKLRPVLENAVWLYRTVARLKRTHPDMDLAKEFERLKEIAASRR